MKSGYMPFANRLEEICDALGIPKRYETDLYYSYQPREGVGLRTYKEAMAENAQMTIGEAHKIYEQYIAKREQKKAEWERQTHEELNRANASQSRSNRAEGSSSSGSFLSSVVGAAIGTAVGTTGSRRELRKQTRLMEEADRRARQAEEQRERDESKRKAQARYERMNIIRENNERARKGLPPLPVPPVDWS